MRSSPSSLCSHVGLLIFGAELNVLNVLMKWMHGALGGPFTDPNELDHVGMG
jgi:hypothetical protein